MININKTINTPSANSAEGIYLVKGSSTSIAGIYVVSAGVVYCLSKTNTMQIKLTTYAELKALYLANTLEANTEYIMTDFRHSQYGKFYDGDPIEPLVFHTDNSRVIDLDNVKLPARNIICSYSFADTTVTPGMDISAKTNYCQSLKSPVTGALKGVIFKLRYLNTDMITNCDLGKIRTANEAKLCTNFIDYDIKSVGMSLDATISIGIETLETNSRIAYQNTNGNYIIKSKVIIIGEVHLADGIFAELSYIRVHSNAVVYSGMITARYGSQLTIDVGCGFYSYDSGNISATQGSSIYLGAKVIGLNTYAADYGTYLRNYSTIKSFIPVNLLAKNSGVMTLRDTTVNKYNTQYGTDSAFVGLVEQSTIEIMNCSFTGDIKDIPASMYNCSFNNLKYDDVNTTGRLETTTVVGRVPITNVIMTPPAGEFRNCSNRGTFMAIKTTASSTSKINNVVFKERCDTYLFDQVAAFANTLFTTYTPTNHFLCTEGDAPAVMGVAPTLNGEGFDVKLIVF